MRNREDYPPVNQVLPFGGMLLIITVAYTTALWIESWLMHGSSGISYAMVSIGVIVGGLTRLPATRWPSAIAAVLAIKVAWLVLIAGQYNAPELFSQAGAQIGIAVLIASASRFLLPEHKRDYLPHEIFTSLTVNTVVCALGYALLMHYDGTPGNSIIVASAFCSVLLGTGITAAPIAVWGMVYGRKADYSWKRIFFLALSIPGFVIFALAALTGSPALVAEFFQPYGNALVWIALFFGLSLANNANTLMLVSLLMFLAFGAAVIFHLQPHADDIAAVVRWQSTAITIHVVTIAAGVLVAGLRRYAQLARQRLRIAESMVAATAKAESADAGRPKVNLIDALEIAGRHCRADECRLYSFDQSTNQATCINIWLRDVESVDKVRLAEPISTANLRGIIDKLAEQKPFFLEGITQRDLGESGYADALHIPEGSEVAFYPISLGERLLGMIGVVGHSVNQLRKRNAAILLSSIGYYYIGIHTQAEAAKNIRHYEDRMSELAARFAEAEERVRRETSTEIHDGLIQQLAVMRMKLGELGQRRISAPETLSTITEIVDETLIESRSMLQRLSPSVLYELGLMPALQTLCDTISEDSQFEITVRESGSRAMLDEPVRVAFYHVIKELVGNSCMHSGGTRIWIDINWGENHIEQAAVSDDGNSEIWWLLRRSGSRHGELGLLAASERLRRFDYLLTFLPRDGGGTSAVIRPAMIFSAPQ